MGRLIDRQNKSNNFGQNLKRENNSIYDISKQGEKSKDYKKKTTPKLIPEKGILGGIEWMEHACLSLRLAKKSRV